MLLMNIRNLKKSYGDHEVLKDVSLEVKSGVIIGLVGNNGEGKTTLANILCNELEYDDGFIEVYKTPLRIGYMRQSIDYNLQSFSNMIEQGEFNLFQENSSKLGLRHIKNWSNERMNHLSGGEKTKLALTEIFSISYDLLILDEPTNHLDYKGIDWLIHKIKAYHGAAIIISHDRYFLDQICDVTAELEDGKLNLYEGNYTFYRNEKIKHRESLLHQYEEQQKRERHIDEAVERLKKWSYVGHKNSNSHETPKEYWRKKSKKKDVQIKNAIRRKEKMREEGVNRPKEETNVVFEFVSDNKRGKSILMAENLNKSFKNNVLFKDSNFYVSRGEKVGLVGENGCGKTTLIKMMLGEEKCDLGHLWVSSTAKIAYLSQEVSDLDEEVSLFEMMSKFDKDHQTQIRTLLASSGITSQMILQPVKTLSLGERTRVKLVFLIVNENDVLILDEPTNHLDLHSREQLEKTLVHYTGTLLIASHDRYLLEKVTDKLLVFENQSIVRHEVGFKMYNEKKVNQKTNKDYERLVIHNKMSYVLSELNKYKKEDPKYIELDKEYHELLSLNKELDRDK